MKLHLRHKMEKQFWGLQLQLQLPPQLITHIDIANCLHCRENLPIYKWLYLFLYYMAGQAIRHRLAPSHYTTGYLAKYHAVAGRTTEIAPRLMSPALWSYLYVSPFLMWGSSCAAGTWLAKTPIMVVPGVILNFLSVDMSKEFAEDWKWKDIPQFVVICDRTI